MKFNILFTFGGTLNKHNLIYKLAVPFPIW